MLSISNQNGLYIGKGSYIFRKKIPLHLRHLHDIAKREKCSIHELATTISKHKFATVTLSTGLRYLCFYIINRPRSKNGVIVVI